LRGGHSRGKLSARSTLSFSRQGKIFDPDLFRLRCQRRLMPAVERRHLDLAAIGAAASGSSAIGEMPRIPLPLVNHSRAPSVRSVIDADLKFVTPVRLGMPDPLHGAVLPYKQGAEATRF